MNESKGAKGGYNDRRRTYIIKKNKALLDQDTEDQKVKKTTAEKDLKTKSLITAFALSAPILKALLEICSKEKITSLNLNMGPNTKSVTFQNKNNPNASPTKINIPSTLNLESFLQETQSYELTFSKAKTSTKEEKQQELAIEKALVNRYQADLEDIYKTLTALDNECNLLEIEYKKTYDKKELEELIEKLNFLIQKLEELKNRIDSSLSLEEELPYLSSLVDAYFLDFTNKKVREEIKDSALYIEISKKLQDLTTKKESLTIELLGQKEKLMEDDEDFDKYKKDYEELSAYNKSVLEFLRKQKEEAEILKEKIATSTTVITKTETKIHFLAHQSKNLLRTIAPILLTPLPKNVKLTALATLMYLNTMRNVLTPKTETQNYTIIDTKDYENEIISNLKMMDDGKEILKDTNRKLQESIKYFEKEYKDYLTSSKELRDLLANLVYLSQTLTEKEQELEEIRKEELSNLKENSAKVKTIGSIEN